MRPIRRPRKGHEDATSTIWKDFLMTLTFIFMLLMGGLSMLAPAAAPDPGRSSISSETIQLYVGESDGAIYYGSLHTAPMPIEDVVKRVENVVNANRPGMGLPVIVHHTPDTPGLFVFNTLSALGRVSGIKTLLALSEYSTPQQKQGRVQQ